MKGKEKKKSWRRRKGEEGEGKKKSGEGEKKRREGEKRRGEKEKGERRRIRNRESSTRDTPPSPDAFPSRKLGNNMTPIKGKLGKNTTPTGRDPEKLIQKLQSDPNKDTRASNIHPMRTSFASHESQNLQKCRIQKHPNHHL